MSLCLFTLTAHSGCPRSRCWSSCPRSCLGPFPQTMHCPPWHFCQASSSSPVCKRCGDHPEFSEILRRKYFKLHCLSGVGGVTWMRHASIETSCVSTALTPSTLPLETRGVVNYPHIAVVLIGTHIRLVLDYHHRALEEVLASTKTKKLKKLF